MFPLSHTKEDCPLVKEYSRQRRGRWVALVEKMKLNTVGLHEDCIRRNGPKSGKAGRSNDSACTRLGTTIHLPANMKLFDRLYSGVDISILNGNAQDHRPAQLWGPRHDRFSPTTIIFLEDPREIGRIRAFTELGSTFSLVKMNPICRYPFYHQL